MHIYIPFRIDAGLIGFKLIHVFQKEQSQFIFEVCSCILFFYWILVPISHLNLLSFFMKGLPGVAESTVSISHPIPFKVNKL